MVFTDRRAFAAVSAVCDAIPIGIRSMQCMEFLAVPVQLMEWSGSSNLSVCECDESQSVSGFCLATEVRNSRSSFVDPLLLGAPPWMVPVRWINYLVRCGPCLCLLFYPDSSGSDDGAKFTDPNWSCQRVFISVILSNVDFHY